MTQRLIFSEFAKRYGLKDKLFTAVTDLIKPQPTGPWIVGGSVRRALSEAAQDSDFDLAFASEGQLAAVQNELTQAKFKVMREATEHVELHGQIGGKSVVLQLLRLAFYPNAEAAIDSFDFTICQFAYDGTELICGDYSLWDLARKRLVLHRLTYGAASVRRMTKYANQGFTFCQGTIVQILEAVAKDPGVINAQVTYVD